MISVRFQGKPFNITVLQAYVPTSNAEEAEVECFYEELHLLAVQETQESSPTPQFKTINSLALNFLYSPTLISIHDHWKNYSLE